MPRKLPESTSLVDTSFTHASAHSLKSLMRLNWPYSYNLPSLSTHCALDLTRLNRKRPRFECRGLGLVSGTHLLLGFRDLEVEEVLLLFGLRDFDEDLLLGFLLLDEEEELLLLPFFAVAVD